MKRNRLNTANGDLTNAATNGDLSNAAANGDLEAFKLLLQNKVPSLDSVWDIAEKNGHLHILKWLYQHNMILGMIKQAELSQRAAKNGQSEILKWSKEIDQIEKIKFLIQFRLSDDKTEWNLAEKNGDLHVLKWLHRANRTSDIDSFQLDNFCQRAAEYGNLEMLKWAREIGSPWDKNTCQSAVINNHLKVLKWARFNDCPWKRDKCIQLAKDKNHFQIVAWMEKYS